MNFYGEDMDCDEDDWYGNGECDCDYPSRKTYPYCPMNAVIRTNVPKLKDMASATVAVALWKHVNILTDLFKANLDCAKEARCWKSLKQQVEGLASKLPIPHSVTAQIVQYIGKVQNEITNWATYHFRSVFLNREKDYIVYNFVTDSIWYSDGTINCKETAKIISKSRSPRVCDVEKYNFLCTYCLKDEMQQMSPVLLNMFQEYVDFEQHPLISYWNCYFSKELRLIPKGGNASLDCAMFRHRFVDNWPAKEYFFDRLSPDDQIRNAIWLIDNCGARYQKVLLVKLNDTQRISVYVERSVQIIMNYVKAERNLDDVLETWYDVRNLITREQFVSLFEQLLQTRAANKVLTDIWTSADTDFKHHFLTYNNFAFIKRILNSFEWTHDFNFVTIVLKDLNAQNLAHATKQVFIDFLEKLFSQREKWDLLDRLSDVFLGEDSKQFKQDFVLNSTSIKQRCIRYYSSPLSENLKSLNETLTCLFSQIPDRIPEYKRNLLHSPESISMCVERFGLNDNSLDRIITDALPSEDLATEFRKKLAFSTPSIRKLKTWLLDENFTHLNNVLDTFLVSDQDKANLKKSLLGEPSQLIRDCFRKRNDSYLQSMLIWVFGNESSVNGFRKSVPVDDIFNTMLEEASGVSSYGWRTPAGFRNSISFDSLDRFLIWRFESSSEVKKYKLRRINSYSNISTITSLLRRRKPEEAKRLETVMKWFFENDKAEIAKFNRTNPSRSKIVKVLQA